MPLSSYNRVEAFLPANTTAERLAANLAMRLMREMLGGVTSTVDDPPPYIGQYRAEDRWIQDAIVIAFADTMDSARILETKLTTLEDALIALYRDADSPQLEFWLTVTPLSRFAREP